MLKRHKIIVTTENMQKVWWTFARGWKNVRISQDGGKTWEPVPSMDTGKWGYRPDWLFELNVPVEEFDFREFDTIWELNKAIDKINQANTNKMKKVRVNKRLVELQFGYARKGSNFYTFILTYTKNKDKDLFACSTSNGKVKYCRDTYEELLNELVSIYTSK